MLSPTPFSLCCTLLLCLPLAFFFSTTTTSDPINNTPNENTHNESPTIPSRSAQNTTKNPSLTLSALHHYDGDNDDDLLFRLAARTNPNPKTPKKIAFMFLTTTPLPFHPLWHLFFYPNQTHKNIPQNLFNIYIHADPTHPYEPPFTGLFAARTIPSRSTRRSDPSLIAAARRLLAHALLHDPSNAMFALLSPSCIPLRSFSFVYRTLTTCSTKSFIEILRDEPGLHARYSARGEDVMLPEVPFENFRVGSQFFVLTRRHARLVVKDRRLWAKFKLPCARVDTCYPEEHYFPTLLSMADARACVPATLTHVDWTGSVGGHPRMYEDEEVGPELIRELQNARPRYGVWNGSVEYPFLFARKFAPESLEPLMKMASDVIFRD
ncbi:glycosyltransferase BC10 [Magnolia sinica]|uniref:glycosyltransferase BC10 n=1 Tax=Magnolia sinica TaxID=86752 RepID=UPI00265AB5AB|nr:glycosyltransferase BC10 [Magnolia sinica]